MLERDLNPAVVELLDDARVAGKLFVSKGLILTVRRREMGEHPGDANAVHLRQRLDRIRGGPPVKADPAHAGFDLRMHVRAHVLRDAVIGEGLSEAFRENGGNNIPFDKLRYPVFGRRSENQDRHTVDPLLAKLDPFIDHRDCETVDAFLLKKLDRVKSVSVGVSLDHADNLRALPGPADDLVIVFKKTVEIDYRAGRSVRRIVGLKIRMKIRFITVRSAAEIKFFSLF